MSSDKARPNRAWQHPACSAWRCQTDEPVLVDKTPATADAPVVLASFRTSTMFQTASHLCRIPTVPDAVDIWLGREEFPASLCRGHPARRRRGGVVAAAPRQATRRGSAQLAQPSSELAVESAGSLPEDTDGRPLLTDYVSAITSTSRMSGEPASRSDATRPRALGISPSRCACRASFVSKVSKMP
jgi:hypothetical protein